MPEPDLKAIATHVAAITQALNLTAAIAEDLRGALQPTVNQVSVLFTEAVIAAMIHGEARGLSHEDALTVALATLVPLQAMTMAATAAAQAKAQ